MKKLLLIFFLTVFFGGLIIPLSIQAAGIYQADGVDVCYEGLVPCGKGKPYWEQGTIVDGECQGIKVSEGVHCQFCHFFVVFKALIDFTLKIVVFIAVLMIVIGGLTFFFSAGDPNKVTKATQILRTVIVGLIIIFCSWLFVNIFFTAIGVANWTKLKDGWFVIECPITLVAPEPFKPLDPADPTDPADPSDPGDPSELGNCFLKDGTLAPINSFACGKDAQGKGDNNTIYKCRKSLITGKVGWHFKNWCLFPDTGCKTTVKPDGTIDAFCVPE